MMNKKAKVITPIVTAIIIAMIDKTFIFDETMKGYFIVFFFGGADLAALYLLIRKICSRGGEEHA